MNDLPQIDGFRLERLLGEGGYGRVYLAEETDGLRRPVALKVFADERAYARELESSRRIEELRREGRHAGIVQTLGSSDADRWIAQEYMEEGSLEDVVGARGPFPWEEALRCVRAAADAVATLHGAGLFHRDVKPANLLLGADGRVRLGDFGLSRALDGTLSAAGSPAFAAPEVIAGQVAPDQRARVDVYGLGATLSFLLTGERARPGRPDAFALERHGAPRPLVELVLTAMAYEPEERPRDAEAFLALLEKSARACSEPREEGVERAGNAAPSLAEEREPMSDAKQTKQTKQTKPATLPPTELPPERDDVRAAVNRCPFCHEGVDVKRSDWVSCRTCLARHHVSCWDEAGRCASCEGIERLTPDEAPAPLSRGRISLEVMVALMGAAASAWAATTLEPQSWLLTVKYSGLAGLVILALGLYLTLRAVREALRAPTRLPLLKTMHAAVFLLPLLSFFGMTFGFMGAYETITKAGIVPGEPALASANMQAWTPVKLAGLSGLPVFVVCFLGLVFKRDGAKKRARAETSPRDD